MKRGLRFFHPVAVGVHSPLSSRPKKTTIKLPFVHYDCAVFDGAEIDDSIGSAKEGEMGANAFKKSQHRAKKQLYNADTRQCVLCGETLEGPFVVHTAKPGHNARMGVVERAITMMNKIVNEADIRGKAVDKCVAGATSSAWEWHKLWEEGEEGKNQERVDGPLERPIRTMFESRVANLSRRVLDASASRGSSFEDRIHELQETDFISFIKKKWWYSIHPSHELLEEINEAEKKLRGNDNSRAAKGHAMDSHYFSKLKDFNRIFSLSADSVSSRLHRLKFLIFFLKDRGILRDSLNLASPTGDSSDPAALDTYSYRRSDRFQICELVGDNVMKVVVPDRLVLLFPEQDGGINSKLSSLQQQLDSNEGLLNIYEYLGLDAILEKRLANNKSKSDVVEAIFGELQTFLWSNEVTCFSERYTAIPTSEHRYVRALVQHVYNELTHMLLMWCIETALDNAKDFIMESTVQRYVNQFTYSGSTKGSQVGDSEMDRGKYDTIPLLQSRRRVNTEAPLPGKDCWYHSSHMVLTSTCPSFEMAVALLNEPTPTPQSIANAYSASVRFVANPSHFSEAVRKALTDSESNTHERSSPGLGASLPRPFSHSAQKYKQWLLHEVRVATIEQVLQSAESSLVCMRTFPEWKPLLEKMCLSEKKLVNKKMSDDENVSGSDLSRLSGLSPSYEEQYTEPYFSDFRPQPDSTNAKTVPEKSLRDLLSLYGFENS